MSIAGSLALFAGGVAIYLFDHLLEHNDRYAGQLDVAVRTFGTPGLHHSDSSAQYDAA